MPKGKARRNPVRSAGVPSAAQRYATGRALRAKAPRSSHAQCVRQLRDMKYSAAVRAMNDRDLIDYAELCGRALARGHARSGDPSAIAGYLGDGDAFEPRSR